MINLLPPEARKHVLTEYWLRVASVWLLLAVVAGAVILSLLFPSYVLIKLQLQAQANTYQQVELEQQSFTEAQAEIRQTNSNMKLLADAANTQAFSSILDALAATERGTVFIENITMDREEEGTITQLVIQGQAATRAELAAFQNQLETAAQFATADLPLENLAQNRDVPFQITITITEPSV